MFLLRSADEGGEHIFRFHSCHYSFKMILSSNSKAISNNSLFIQISRGENKSEHGDISGRDTFTIILQFLILPLLITSALQRSTDPASTPTFSPANSLMRVEALVTDLDCQPAGPLSIARVLSL